MVEPGSLSYRKQRSEARNHPRRAIGIDGRLGAARRFTEIMDDLIATHVGGDTTALREIAGLKVSIELTTTAVLNGDKKARTDIVRLSNLVSRREREMVASLAKPKAETPSLHDYLAGKSDEAGA